ncbi:hypothetical protein ACD661_13175 [Legionella lytica]|uniref:Substrate of the Dot/Icm secretion system n=1 Tax=Legionella lytica TaxID=96232 RepID=A0ABW8D9Y1_9GAMM
MKVQRISEYIEELRKEGIQAECDAALLDKITTYFLSKPLETPLNKPDIVFLIECFAVRWQTVRGKNHDYTLSNSPIERIWVNLARELSTPADIPYLKILMSSITNDKDPHDGSALTQTETMTNFYLANQGTVLCRKRSLCDYLLAHNHQLVTSRSMDAAVVFTLDELSSLKRCKVNSCFSIETKGDAQISEPQSKTEYFTSFWDFLQRKVFTSSSNVGSLPMSFLAPLFELVECYMNLKVDGKEFNCFQKKASEFFEHIYNSAAADVNSLYGQRVFYKDREHHLLDVLIAIFDATQFNLEQEIYAITTLLFHLHPELEAKSSLVHLFYLEEQKKPQHILKEERKKPAYTAQNEVTAYINCCRLLVSLFVTKFYTGFLYKGKEISTWDQPNEIPAEFYGIYQHLIKLYNSDKPNYIDVYYDEIQSKITAMKKDQSPWVNIRPSASLSWLKKANALDEKDSNLEDEDSALEGYWYPKELILHRLLRFVHTATIFKKPITDLLDELVTTYAQEEGCFRKELRVNILFSQFLSKLNKQQRQTLETFMTSADGVSSEGVEGDFLNNCIVHINSRLVELGYHQPIDKSPSFFHAEPCYKIDPALVEGVEHLIEVIEHYATKLELGHLASDVQGKIRRFLFDLKNPILSCEEKKETLKETETRVDPIGQPS